MSSPKLYGRGLKHRTNGEPQKYSAVPPPVLAIAAMTVPGLQLVYNNFVKSTLRSMIAFRIARIQSLVLITLFSLQYDRFQSWSRPYLLAVTYFGAVRNGINRDISAFSTHREPISFDVLTHISFFNITLAWVSLNIPRCFLESPTNSDSILLTTYYNANINMLNAAALITYLRHQRLIMDFVHTTSVTLLTYDYLLTLHLEVKLIWFARWSYTTGLFFMIRYMTLVCVFLAAYGQLMSNIPLEDCKIIWHLKGWLTVLLMVFAESVLAIRTLAVWKMNKVVGVGLVALTLAHLIIQSVWLNKFEHSIKYSPLLYEGFRGCLLLDADKILWKQYTALTVVEAIVLSLMAISAFQSRRRGNPSRLMHVIHRDGISFYIYLLCLAAANVFVTMVLPVDLTNLLTSLQTTLYSVLTTRVVLNIRDVSNRGVELHDTKGCDEPLPTLMPLQFYSGDHTVSSQGCTDSQGCGDQQTNVS